MGKTVPEIRTELEGIVPIEKLSFGCCGVETFNQKLDRLGRKQVILAGIETHVCVLQTADDHAERLRYPCGGRCNLFKEEIRLGDRSEMDGKKGAMISTTEIIAFRLLKEAGTEEFRRLSKLLK